MKREMLALNNVSVDDYEFGELSFVSLCVYRGETVAIAGLTSSGKRVLFRLLSGVLHNYHGEVRIKGQTVRLCGGYFYNGTGDIAVIGTKPRVFADISIIDNLKIANGPRHLWRLMCNEKNYQNITDWARLLGIELPKQPIAKLSRFEVTLLELLKGLVGGAAIIVFTTLYEYCSELNANRLKQIIGKLNTLGVTVLLEHDDMFPVFDDVISRYIVLRNGAVTATIYKDENEVFDNDKVRHAIVGRIFKARPLNALSSVQPDNSEPYAAITIAGMKKELEIYRGSLIGIYDAAEEMPQNLEELLGNWGSSFAISVCGQALQISGVRELIAHGLAVLTKESANAPIFPNLSPAENVGILAQQVFSRRHIYSRQVSGYLFDWVIKKYDLLHRLTEIKNKKDCFDLSYERQYEIFLAKWLAINPQVFVTYAPLATTDIINFERYRELLIALAKEGKAVVVISSNYDYLENVCREIYIH